KRSAFAKTRKSFARGMRRCASAPPMSVDSSSRSFGPWSPRSQSLGPRRRRCGPRPLTIHTDSDLTMRSAFVALIVGATTLNSSLHAQTIQLRIKPHAGDTLSMQLDQQMEMTGTHYTSGGEASNLVVTTMQMYSRAVVEGIAD